MTDSGAGGDRRPGRPRDPELDGTILRATMDLLCEQGFSGTTVEAVAERAGVGKATIYRRWATREDLLLAAGGEMGPCPGDPDCGNVRDDLVVIARGLVSMVTDSPVGALLPATVDEAARNPEMRSRLDAFIDARRDTARAVLARAAARGELRDGLDYELVIDLVSGPIFNRALLTGAPLKEGVAERIVDTLLNGVLVPERP